VFVLYVLKLFSCGRNILKKLNQKVHVIRVYRRWRQKQW